MQSNIISESIINFHYCKVTTCKTNARLAQKKWREEASVLFNIKKPSSDPSKFELTDYIRKENKSIQTLCESTLNLNLEKKTSRYGLLRDSDRSQYV